MNISTNISGNGFPGTFVTNGRPQILDAKRQATLQTEAQVKSSKSVKTKEKAEDVIAHLEKLNLSFNKKLKFVIDQESQEITVNVVDPNTNKVIKVLPPEELQRLNVNLEEAAGTMVDEKI
ncbi:MAG: flagellar protein FlaG [Spirochaetaceae bacterium]|jgi:flagellar protein FlaG|nr:flagellar protein FlaG [Spirochaetaceae bacterium]